ncbi:DUF2971 domain-containing protein [Vibrio harveyi]|uniref:DUF2971 domain-containing protein n=1 Tax=Vibrio harveyi TaxID=669 RepID=UPI000683303E|nr:DUF2971 domain-containing protein [Vibrio harveyi]
MVLWHYTSIDVLTSIIGCRKPTLRATHIDFLNDAAELRHGLRAIKEIMVKFGSASSSNVVSQLDEFLDDGYDPHLYSFSLSEAKNSLYQWLAYCPKDGGVSLGFEFSDNMIMRDIPSYRNVFELPLPNCPYPQIPQYRKCNYFSSPDEIKSEWYCPQPKKSTAAELLINAMFLKHSAFHFEQEHRLFFHPMPDSDFYVPPKFQGAKPYIEFNFEPSILKYVYISPRGNKSLVEKAVKKILSTHGYQHVEVLVSDIPFRE